MKRPVTQSSEAGTSFGADGTPAKKKTPTGAGKPKQKKTIMAKLGISEIIKDVTQDVQFTDGRAVSLNTLDDNTWWHIVGIKKSPTKYTQASYIVRITNNIDTFNVWGNTLLNKLATQLEEAQIDIESEQIIMYYSETQIGNDGKNYSKIYITEWLNGDLGIDGMIKKGIDRHIVQDNVENCLAGMFSVDIE